jgi:hypothetical protein
LKIATVEWNDLNLEAIGAAVHPVMWEMSATPVLGGAPQDLLNDEIVDASDVLVAVFLGRLGSPTEREPSGTVEEIKRMVAAGRPVLVYFMTKSVLLEDIDPQQLAALHEFKKWCASQGIYRECRTDEQLHHEFERDLTRVIRDLRAGSGGDNRPAKLVPVVPPFGSGVAPLKSEVRALVAQFSPRFEGALRDWDADRGEEGDAGSLVELVSRRR